MFQQEEAKREAGIGEDWCHPSAYNRRLRATQSPKFKQTHMPRDHKRTNALTWTGNTQTDGHHQLYYLPV